VAEEIRAHGVTLKDLPAEDRERLLRRLLTDSLAAWDSNIRQVYDQAMPGLALFTANRLPLPPILRACAEHALEQRLGEMVEAVAVNGEAPAAEQTAKVEALLEEARRHGVPCRQEAATRRLAETAASCIQSLAADASLAAVERILGLLRFAEAAGLAVRDAPSVQEAYWQFVNGPARTVIAAGANGQEARQRNRLVDGLLELGKALGFATGALGSLKEISR
jgi:hypothetical protein